MGRRQMELTFGQCPKFAEKRGQDSPVWVQPRANKPSAKEAQISREMVTLTSNRYEKPSNTGEATHTGYTGIEKVKEPVIGGKRG